MWRTSGLLEKCLDSSSVSKSSKSSFCSDDFYENSNQSADGIFEAIQMIILVTTILKFTNMRALGPNLIKGNFNVNIVYNCVRHAMSFLSYDKTCDFVNVSSFCCKKR